MELMVRPIAKVTAMIPEQVVKHCQTTELQTKMFIV